MCAERAREGSSGRHELLRSARSNSVIAASLPPVLDQLLRSLHSRLTNNGVDNVRRAASIMRP
jgi:hypothetical protein